MKKQVSVLVGAGSIGQAIIRRVSAGKHVILADLGRECSSGSKDAGRRWLRVLELPNKATFGSKADILEVGGICHQPKEM